MPLIPKNVVLSAFVLILLLTASCGTQEFPESGFPLKTWDFRIKGDTEWIKVNAVPWEWPVEKGGAGICYNGEAEYRLNFDKSDIADYESFPLPYVTGNEFNQLYAFFTPCIDDADKTYLNGVQINEGGVYPGGDEPYCSGVREARLYMILPSLIKEKNNELLIKVYDHMGLGGFCYPQTPLIGKFKELKQLERYHRHANDIPRIFGIALSFIILVFLISKFFVKVINRFLNADKNIHPSIFSYTLSEIKSVILNIISSFRPSVILLYNRKDNPLEITDEEIFTKIVAGVIVCIGVFLFLSAELSFRFDLYRSDHFWTVMPPLAFSFSIIGMLYLLHNEVFFSSLLPKKAFSRTIIRLLSATGHPWVAVFMLLVLVFTSIFYSYENTWNLFANLVIFVFIVIFVMFLGTIYHLVRNGPFTNGISRYSLLIQAAARIFILIGLSAALLVWEYSPVMYNSFLMASSFVLLYVILTITFADNTRIRLPLKTFYNRKTFLKKIQEDFPPVENIESPAIKETHARNCWYAFLAMGHEDAFEKRCSEYGRISRQVFNNQMSQVYKRLNAVDSRFSSERNKYSRLIQFLQERYGKNI